MSRWLSVLTLCLSISVEAAITIGTYNIRNFDYDERYRIHTNKGALLPLLKSLNADILSIQEINNTAEFGRFLSANLPGYDFEVTRCGGAHGQHLGFLYNKSKIELLAFNEDLSISSPGSQGTCDSGSRPLAIALFRIKSTGQRFYGLTVHLKAGGQSSSQQKRIRQYQIIRNTIRELRSKTGVKDFYVAGDFNTTEYRNRGSDYQHLTRMVADLGMIDLSANLPCTAYYWGGTDDGIESPSMLDHIIVSPGLIKNKSTKAQIHAHCAEARCQETPFRQLGVIYQSVSDHCPITVPVQ